MAGTHTLLLAPFLFLLSCTDGQPQGAGASLPAGEFRQKLAELPTASLVDVRTPEEYSKGHLAHALNWNWTDGQFTKKVADLDPAEPVFVYCLSGGRSAQAVDLLRSKGFQQVYELRGGIMKWNAAGLPTEVPDGAVVAAGMTKAEFGSLLDTDKTVLVDFYADWCAPCKRMKPYLDEISKDMAGTVTVVRINADENPALCKELGVDALPVLQVYKERKLTWRNVGYIAKDAVVRQL